MSFKFLVGQNVEYTPIGEKTAGLYKIMWQMAGGTADRIKIPHQERNRSLRA
jgi:hypothetical protein